MGASVPYGFDAKGTRRPSPPAGAAGTERDALEGVHPELDGVAVDLDAPNDDRVERHWTEADRLAFLARAQRVNWR